MNTMIALPIAAALPVAAPAMVPAINPDRSAGDPIFDAIDLHRQAVAACSAVPRGVDIPDELGDRCGDAFRAVLRTRPTTPAGLVALTTWAREEADRLRQDCSMLYSEDLHALCATIDDAARGMSGLQAWSPAAPDRPASEITDKDLVDLAQQFEDLLAVEVPLENESHRLHEAARRLMREKMGIDPADEEAARKARLEGNYDEWNAAWDAADKEVRYHEAYRKWNLASKKTAKVGKKILKLKPSTVSGLMILARVIDQHDEIGEGERDEQLMLLIEDFAERNQAAA